MLALGLNKSESYLLACSGGKDSMCLAALLERNGFSYDLIHVNYGLRGEESDADEELVREWSKTNSRFFYCVHASEEMQDRLANGENLQHAARQIRYREFHRVRKEATYHRILIAHHAQDRLEGLFISLIRGESWSKMAGMPLVTEDIARPLHSFSSEELNEFAYLIKLNWREDHSNFGDAYLRNRIRHHIVPFVKEQNAAWLDSLDRLQNDLLAVQNQLDILFEVWKENSISIHKGNVRIDRKRAKEFDSRWLKRWLSEYTSLPSLQISNIPEKGSGQEFHLGDFSLYVERGYLDLRRKSDEEVKDFQLLSAGEYSLDNGQISIEKVKGFPENIQLRGDIAIIDAAKASFPWKVRSWKHGDRFRPIGMKGSKLLSDYFIDRKWSRSEKDSLRLLEIDGEIAWLIGHRLDARFAANDQSKEVYLIRFAENA